MTHGLEFSHSSFSDSSGSMGILCSVVQALVLSMFHTFKYLSLRWQATEVNCKHLKTTLKMEMIAAKIPGIIQKEVWVHLLSYNLLRTLMGRASKQTSVSALRISLQGTRKQLNHFRSILADTQGTDNSRLYNAFLTLVAELLVPLRPHRAEPRVLQRRPKAFLRMQQPRKVLKAKLAD